MKWFCEAVVAVIGMQGCKGQFRDVLTFDFQLMAWTQGTDLKRCLARISGSAPLWRPKKLEDWMPKLRGS